MKGFAGQAARRPLCTRAGSPCDVPCRADVAAADEQEGSCVTPARQTENRVVVLAVVGHESGQVLGHGVVDAADEPQAFIERAIGDPGIRPDRHVQERLEVLAEGGVIGVTRRSADPVGARPQDERGTALSFLQDQPVGEGSDLVGTRVVFQACRERRQEPVCQGEAPRGPWDLVVDPPCAEDPSIFERFSGPPDRSAFAGSEGSTGDQGRSVQPDSCAVVVMLMSVSLSRGRWNGHADRRRRG